MLVPLSWLKEYVDIDIPVELLAERLTVAGLEVSHIRYIGLPQGRVDGVRWPESDHLVWDDEKLLLGAIREVKPHPDADRLVLAMVDYGGAELEQCVTGAPNLFPYRGLGPLAEPLWTAFAMEGAEVWDGHSDTPKRMILKGKSLRGIYNKSMVCSEKELGISDEHEGVIVLDARPEYVPGTPLSHILGDVVLNVELTPNLARAFSVVGIAREVAALLGKEMRYPSYDVLMEGAPIDGQIAIEIREPELNPRFTVALLKGTSVKPSPQWMQRRLKLAGQRPINNIVDVTNYITFEMGQPLHAYDYDKLVARAGGQAPSIVTRLPHEGETLTTLDGVVRRLDAHNILVCDAGGALGLGGVIGGADTEIDEHTTNVLLEAANWNFINVRRTMQSQKVHTEAGTRFSRGVHPSQAILGVQRGIELMRQTGGGQVAKGIVDVYPNPPQATQVTLPISEVQRLLGLPLSIQVAADILSLLQFDVTLDGDVLHVTVPDHRMDIGTGVIGQADLVEEIARVYGYDKIPNTIMDDALPTQWTNTALDREERVRDLLVHLGLHETISYRFTTPQAEQALVPPGAASSLPDVAYVQLANPISSEHTVLRHTLLVSLLENAARNARHHARQQLFEIGKVYWDEGERFPAEPTHLGILLVGPRDEGSWDGVGDSGNMDFYDMKGVIEGLLDGLHISGARYERGQHTSWHPGRSATLYIGETAIGTFGQLHPIVAERWKLASAPLLVAELDLEALVAHMDGRHRVRPLPITPSVLEDIALVVAEATPAADVEAVIRKAGGDLLKEVRLFDVYRGPSIPSGTKSLAYALAYQTDERTLTDSDVAKVRKKIIALAERELGAKLRS